MTASLPILERKSLEEVYDCYGHFYNIYDKDSLLCNCRSTMEIIDKRLNVNENQIFNHSPNSIFIMMNPGSSDPVEGLNKKTDIQKIDISLMGRISKEQKSQYISKAKPDLTQYFVMKLMREKNWRHVTVLNLSDIRAASKSKLINTMGEFILEISKRNIDCYHIHSICDEIRRKEVLEILDNAKDVPIIKAWGVSNSPVHYFAPFWCSLLTERNSVGYKKDCSNFCFYHPLYEGWYDKILELV